MPAPAWANLFDLAKSQSRKGTAGEKGTGFGMLLMHKFITQFGGRVEVVSRDVAQYPENHGTEFKLQLKLAEIPSENL
jgi:K+-sensing histidine kinase KdpD